MKNKLNKEFWCFIHGYDGLYSVSNCRNNTQKHKRVNRLVAIAFVPNINNKPQVNHKDGNKLNNKIENLEWVTSSENKIHSIEMGLVNASKGEKHWNVKLNIQDVYEIRSLRKSGGLYREIAEKFKVNTSTIADIIKKRTWIHIAEPHEETNE